MNTIQITTHSQLMSRIVEINATKDLQEEELKISFRKAIASIELFSIFKGGMLNQGSQPNALAQAGLNMALNLIIDLVLGKHRSIKGYLSSVLVEKIISSLINNNLKGTISTISSLLSRKSQFEKSREFNQ